jgi:tRNA (cytidine32/uridine32-2'-O)-methyltransferase
MNSQIRVVLVETSHPGNIGAAARAMKNMCLQTLYLVRPKLFPHDEATARASGADDVLENAVVVDTLQQAIADCQLVYGASARLRSLPWPLSTPRECAAQVVEAAQAGHVALVFGRERTGLSNEELALCQSLVHIPTNPDYASLNVAAAVQILAYEVLMASQQTASQPIQAPDSRLATQQEVEGMFEHLESTLIDLDYLDPQNPRQLMRRLRRLFNRVQLEDTEVNIIRGICKAAGIKQRK